MTKRAILLLGSGASLHAGLPSTDAIMVEIESKKDYARHNNRLIPRTTERFSDNNLRDDAQKVIQKISKKLKDYYQPMSYRISYEDVANVIDALYDPMHHPYVQPYKAELEMAVIGSTSDYSFALNPKLDQASRFIEEAVYRMTSVCPQSAKLDFIFEGFNCQSLRLGGIITLNYDIVVEQLLTERNIPFVDGFNAATPLPSWSPNALQSETGIPYLKMHGSASWWEAMQDNSEWHLVKARWRPDASSFGYFTEPRAKLLIGTENKVMAYSRSPYSFLRACALQSLENSDIVVSVGYGFKDAGINGMLVDWIYRHPNRGIVIIDPSPGEIVKNKAHMWQFAKGWLLKSTAEELHWQSVENTVSNLPENFAPR